MSTNLVLIPSNKAKYKTKEHALYDWNNGQEFKVLGIDYCFDINTIGAMLDKYDEVLIVWSDKNKPIVL